MLARVFRRLKSVKHYHYVTLAVLRRPCYSVFELRYSGLVIMNGGGERFKVSDSEQVTGEKSGVDRTTSQSVCDRGETNSWDMFGPVLPYIYYAETSS